MMGAGRMKTGVKILLGMIGVLLLLFAILAVSLFTAGKKLEAVETVDIDTVEDGSYYGSADTVLVKVKVEVSVKDHKIVKIDLLKHQNGRGTPAETMIGAMLDGNTSDVDAVSGATLSSRAIRAAVNEALAEGVKK